jgi:hypothetical protein
VQHRPERKYGFGCYCWIFGAASPLPTLILGVMISRVSGRHPAGVLDRIDNGTSKPTKLPPGRQGAKSVMPLLAFLLPAAACPMGREPTLLNITPDTNAQSLRDLWFSKSH